MDEFDEMFEEIPQKEKEPKKYENRDKSNYSKNGKKRINLFEDNPEQLQIKMGNVKIHEIATIVFPTKFYKIDDDTKKLFRTILKKLNEKGIELRIMCENANQIHEIIVDIYNNDKVVYVAPYKSFCKVKEFKIWTPSDLNIQAAAYHFKNFDNLSVFLKSIDSAVITTLFGLYNNRLLKYVITHDTFTTDQSKPDYKQSKNVNNFYVLGKQFGVTIYNVHKEQDIKDLSEVLKD